MKYKPKIYAAALAETILTKKLSQKETIDRFLNLLEKNGDIRKAKEIVTLAETILLKKAGKSKVRIEIARKVEGDLPALLRKVLQASVIEEILKPSLIAGVNIIVNGEQQLDFSLKSKLDEIFKI